MKRLAILGIRGIPASHGGFETFAENLSVALKDNDWQVVVYCQKIGGEIEYTTWKGIELVKIPVKNDTSLSTIIFDIKSTYHACKNEKLLLTLGYNTAFLSIYCRIAGAYNFINMDGIEWKRSKWSLPIKIWFYINERIACVFGNQLIADHPEIKNHLSTRVNENKITMIPYGANHIKNADERLLDKYKLKAGKYITVIARPEPENSILEIVRVFSAKSRNIKLVVLGKYTPETITYHAEILSCASDEVVFLGAIYDNNILESLRYFSLFYIHGHQVGGTNPSLIEALGAGNPVLAKDNKFNRWVTDNKMLYFKNDEELEQNLNKLISDDEIINVMKKESEIMFMNKYQWPNINKQYEDIFLDYLQSIGSVNNIDTKKT